MTSTPARRNSSSKETGWLKMLIMVGSLAITLAGWGILATEEWTAAVAAPSVTTIQSNPPSNSSPTLRPANPPAAQFRSAARTRSSR